MITINTDLVNGRTNVFVENTEMKFPGFLLQLIECPNAYVILLGDSEIQKCPENNIYAIAKTGGILWNIKEAVEKQLGKRKDQWYPEMRMTVEGLSVLGFYGVRYLIDIEQGKCIRTQTVR